MQTSGRFDVLSAWLAEKEIPLPINRRQVDPNDRLYSVEKTNTSALEQNLILIPSSSSP